jgi:hypothetical protein
MLGENGHILLAQDIAGSPYVTFQSALTLPAGTYTMQMTVRDRVARTSVSVKKPFDLKKADLRPRRRPDFADRPICQFPLRSIKMGRQP